MAERAVGRRVLARRVLERELIWLVHRHVANGALDLTHAVEVVVAHPGEEANETTSAPARAAALPALGLCWRAPRLSDGGAERDGATVAEALSLIHI